MESVIIEECNEHVKEYSELELSQLEVDFENIETNKRDFIRKNIEREFSEKEFEMIEKLNQEFHSKNIPMPEDMKCLPLPTFNFNFTLLKKRKSTNTFDMSNIKNVRNEFLILLRKSDYKKRFYLCNKSNYELLQEYEEEFDGNLNLVNVKDDFSEKYKIYGIVYSHIVYIKLPKEQIYVLPELFPYKYMESQHEELKHIFALLGAKSIKWTIVNKNEDNHEIGAKVNVCALNVGAGAGFENTEYNSDLFKNEGMRTFPNNKIVPNVKNILNDKSIYYLMMEDSWKDIIKRRIESNVEYDKFSYLYQNKMSIKKGFDIYLDKLGIQFNYQNSIMKKCEIHYEITYYPLVA